MCTSGISGRGGGTELIMEDISNEGRNEVVLERENVECGGVWKKE